MAMDGKALGDEIASAIINTAAPQDVKERVKVLWEKIGAAIVNHIASNAEVLPGIPLKAGPYSGDTTGSGSVI